MEKETIQGELVLAMKNKDKNRIAALRQVIQAVKNKEIETQTAATATDIMACIKKLVKMNREELAALESNPSDREERIATLHGQLDALMSLMPKQVSGDELKALVDRGIDAVGATTRRDTGKVIGWLVTETDGNLDKAEAARLIGQALA